MGAKWGQCTSHVITLPPLLLSSPLTHTRTHTQMQTHTLNWITSLGLEMKRRDMPASTDALCSYSGGASAFSPSLWNLQFLCAVVFHVWHKMHCHFGRFYLSGSVGVRGPGFGLKSLGDKGWRSIQPGVGLWSEWFSHFSNFFCCFGVLWCSSLNILNWIYS